MFESVSEPVDISRMSFAALAALAIIAILVAATALAIAAQVAVVGVVLIVASSPVQAAVLPLGPGLQAMWDVTFGRAFGAFPTGSFPGEGLTGYGTCDKATWLRAEQNRVCREKGSCEDGGCDSEKIKQMSANQTACIEARINTMMTCFNGGDEAHWGEVRKRLAPIERCQKCLSDTMAGQFTE